MPVEGPWWDEAIIVGGGPSIRDFPFSRLRGRNVIAVNDAVFHLPFAAVAFSADKTWITRRMEDLIGWRCGERYLAMADPVDAPGLTCLDRIRGPGLSTDPTAVHVSTSGYGALNLAFLKRAKRIMLLGFDGGGGGHWFPGYPWQPSASPQRLYPQWNEHFQSAVPQLEAAGVEVLNCNPASRIMAFPRVSWLTVLGKE